MIMFVLFHLFYSIIGYKLNIIIFHRAGHWSGFHLWLLLPLRCPSSGTRSIRKRDSLLLSGGPKVVHPSLLCTPCQGRKRHGKARYMNLCWPSWQYRLEGTISSSLFCSRSHRKYCKILLYWELFLETSSQLESFFCPASGLNRPKYKRPLWSFCTS